MYRSITVLICSVLTVPGNAAPPAPPPTLSQSPSAETNDVLSIGSVRLRLGMPRDIVLSDLRKYYALQRLEPSTDSYDNWVIMNKTNHAENLGSLRFRSGKLTVARKEWTYVDKEYSGADTMEIIYKLTSEFASEGNTNCRIRTFSSVQQAGPGGQEFRETEITCGHRQIELILSWQAGPASVQVAESILDDAEMIP